MFSIHYGEENLSVVFKSDNVIRVARHGFEDVQQLTCAIFGNGNRPKAIGYALCSELDQPNDVVGMELALGRALDRLVFGWDKPAAKRLRTQFWDAFHRAVDGTVDELYEVDNFLAFVDGYLEEATVSFDIETPPTIPFLKPGTIDTVSVGPTTIGAPSYTLPYNVVRPFPYPGTSVSGNISTETDNSAVDEVYGSFNTNQERIDNINAELLDVTTGRNRCGTDCPICENLREELAELQTAA